MVMTQATHYQVTLKNLLDAYLHYKGITLVHWDPERLTGSAQDAGYIRKWDFVWRGDEEVFHFSLRTNAETVLCHSCLFEIRLADAEACSHWRRIEAGWTCNLCDNGQPDATPEPLDIVFGAIQQGINAGRPSVHERDLY